MTLSDKGQAPDYEKQFIELVNDPDQRGRLLERLEKLGLLSAFLQAENETIQ